LAYRFRGIWHSQADPSAFWGSFRIPSVGYDLGRYSQELIIVQSIFALLDTSWSSEGCCE
ncbi:MAG: hypothetical protein ACK6A7_10645, partial [Planctomycetota bacterium]